jgi:Tol biopolymer transport system component
MSDPSEDEPKQPKPYTYVPRPTDDQVFATSKRWRLLGLIVAAILLLLIGGFFLFPRRKIDVYAPAAAVRTLPISQWTSDPGISMTPAFSHDGKLVAYASDREGPGNLAIWLRPYPSGAPRRLTKEEFHATDPDFSPDDSQIVYHSDRDGGGVYILPVSGAAEPRLLVKGAMRPRFSPNGKWIAYFTTSEGGTTPFGGGRIYVVAPEGGAPKQIRPDFSVARDPIWLPGADVLLFEGIDGQGAADWWVTPVDGGDTVRTHALEKLRNVGVRAPPERFDRGRVLFAATSQANLHLWELALDPKDWQASGAPRQLTNSDGIDQRCAVAPDGRILFGSMKVTIDIWSLPLEGLRATGSLQRVTDDHAVNQAPSIGASGARLIYISNRTGTRDLWVNDLKTGASWAVTAFHSVSHRPVLSADENRVAFQTVVDNHCAVVLENLNQHTRRNLSSLCFNVWDWSPDGSSLLIYDPAEATVSAQLLKTDSGQRQPLISRPGFNVYDAGFARDGKWIAFTAGATIAGAEVFVAPFRGAAIQVSEWIPITHGGGSLSAWSPDSSALYFHSARDGFHCIWAQPLNGAKRAIGDPVAIVHLHQASPGMYMIRPNDFHMSATKDRLVFNLMQETANLWITDRRD